MELTVVLHPKHLSKHNLKSEITIVDMDGFYQGHGSEKFLVLSWNFWQLRHNHGQVYERVAACKLSLMQLRMSLYFNLTRPGCALPSTMR